MAENEPITPEQQLLKLIEGQNKPGEGPAPAKAKARGGFSFGTLLHSALASLSFWKRHSKKKAHGRPFAIGIGEVNKGLIILATGQIGRASCRERV